MSYDRMYGYPKQALLMVDLGTESVRHLWSEKLRKDVFVVAVGFDHVLGDPCYLTCSFGPQPDELRESAMLLKYDAQANRAVEVARISATPGWEIELPTLSPDGNGVAAVSFGPEPKAGTEAPNDVLLWYRDGRVGRERLPSGVDGSVLAWSRDGRRIAISEWDGIKTKIAVYEFSR